MLKRAVQILLSTFGYKLVPADNYRPSWNLVHFFPLLKSFGFAPRHIWDVGANRGDWTRTAIRYFPDSEYTLLEPQDNLKKNLDDLIRRGIDHMDTVSGAVRHIDECGICGCGRHEHCDQDQEFAQARARADNPAWSHE